ncbi:TPA: lipase family protein [Vibrio parahaemolyticus]|nr:lipase family protein [Vibrio parahaemolyticus]
MAKLTPKMASEIADIPYKAYENNGRFIMPGENSFSNHFSFSENDVFDGFTGGVAGLSNVPVLRKVIPGLMRTSEAFAVVGTGKGSTFKNEIVISIRGTQNANDWITNANIGVKGSPNGSPAHAGFNNCFQSISPKLKQYIMQIYPKPKRIHCVGHSLGGALASLCADWVRSEMKVRTTLYTFGAPRVGLEAYARSSEKLNDGVYRCTHGADPVPKVPLWPFIHAPISTGEYRLDSGTGLSISAHLMARNKNPGYLNTAASDSWGALKRKSNDHLFTPIRLKYEQRNQASFSEYWADRIQGALITYLKDVALLSTVTIQAGVIAGLTFYDWLSRKLESVAKSSKCNEEQLKGLLGHMLVFAGHYGTIVEDLSARFIRWVFEKTIGRLVRVSKQAISLLS